MGTSKLKCGIPTVVKWLSYMGRKLRSFWILCLVCLGAFWGVVNVWSWLLLPDDRFIHYIDMKTLIIPSLTTSISSAPLELHYFDEYSLFVVFLTEIMYVFYGIADLGWHKLISVVNTTQPFHPTWAIDPRKDSYLYVYLSIIIQNQFEIALAVPAFLSPQIESI